MGGSKVSFLSFFSFFNQMLFVQETRDGMVRAAVHETAAISRSISIFIRPITYILWMGLMVSDVFNVNLLILGNY